MNFTQSVKKTAVSLVLILSAQLLFVCVAGASERVALLIGNSRYENATPLRNPENDIELVGNSLERAGFRLTKGINLTADATAELISGFLSEIRATKNPTVVFYFAGHAVQFAGKNYLLAIDSPINNRKGVIAEAVDAHKVLTMIEAVSPSLALIVLDSCRHDPFEKATRGLKIGLSPMRVKNDKKRLSKLIAFSTAPGEVAVDGDAGTSPYAAAFAESILIPGLSVEEVFQRTRRAVFERTKGEQEPWEDGAVYERFEFIAKKQAKGVTKAESEIWDFASIVNTAEAYQRYLDKYPQGTFEKIARLKIDAINKDFSYRRKAERFPILVTRRNDFDRCWGGKKVLEYTGADDRMSFNTVKYANQVAYIDFRIPLNAIFCGGYHRAMSFFKGRSKACDLLVLEGYPEGVESRKIECITQKVQFDYTGIGDLLRSNGGLKFTLGDGTWVIPNLNSTYFEFSVDYVEGIWDEMYLSVRGLVRIRSKLVEHYHTVSLEPIDPKAIGLTWKYQNTLNEARNEKNAVRIAKEKRLLFRQ